MLLFYSITSVAKTSRLDSLRQCLATAKEDTSAFLYLLRIGNVFQKSNNDSAVFYHNKARNLARKIKDRVREGHAILQLGTDAFLAGNLRQASKLFNVASGTGKQYILTGNSEQLVEAKKLYAGALTSLATLSQNRGDYHSAIQNNLKAMNIFDEVGFVNGHMGALGNIGNIYNDMGNYAMALEYNFKALKIAEENKNSKGKAINLLNIGTIYNFQGDHEKALEYFLKALKIYESKKNYRDKAAVLGDIAQVYTDKKQFSKALQCCSEALELFRKTGVESGESVILGQIGLIYNCKGDSALQNGGAEKATKEFYPKALEFYNQANALNQKSGNRAYIATTLGNMGDLYISMKNYSMAEKLLNEAYAISSKLGAEEIMKDNALFLSRLYETTNRPVLALEFFKKHVQYKDSVNSSDVTRKTTRLEMKYTYEKKATADSTKAAEEQKASNIKLEASEAKLKQDKIIKTLLYGGLGIVIVFALFILNRFQVTRKQKDIIEKQKTLVESKNQVIEQKQKEILDSIHYAKRIQMALLPSEKRVAQIFKKLLNKY